LDVWGETVPNTYLSATPRIYQRRILLYGVPERNVEDLRTPGAPRFAAPFQHQARAAFRSPFLPLRADFRKILQNLRSYTGHQNGIQSVESIRVPEGDSGIKKTPEGGNPFRKAHKIGTNNHQRTVSLSSFTHGLIFDLTLFRPQGSRYFRLRARSARLPFDLFALGQLESKVQSGIVSSRCVFFVHAPLPFVLFALGQLESKVQCGTVNSRPLRFVLAALDSSCITAVAWPLSYTRLVGSFKTLPSLGSFEKA